MAARRRAGEGQVAVGLQLTQRGGDAGGTLGEAVGEGLDVDAGACGQRLDVHAETNGEQRQLDVLREVVADHREAGGVAGVVVRDAGGMSGGGANAGAWVRPGVGLAAGNG